MEACVYCWTDWATRKLYIGFRKGSIDGYVSSSRIFNEEYNKRRSDFTREIIATGSIVDMLALETKLLTAINAKENDQFYNMHNGDGKFVNKGHTEATRQKMSILAKGKRSSERKGIKAPKPPHGLLGTKQTLAHKTKRAASLLGKSKSPEQMAKLLAASHAKFPCEHCGLITTRGNLKRWHGPNCKRIK